MHLTVAIATSGRREILSKVLATFARQTRAPDLVAVCPARDEDLDQAALEALPFPAARIAAAAPGLPAQRNAILRALADSELLLFLDDDFLMADDFLARMEETFAQNPDAVMLTGEVVADGAQGAGIAFDEAEAMLAGERAPSVPALTDVYNCYGCNMALRADVARREGVEFDENLPLYGWLEDVDFSRRMAPFGKILKAAACRGVHMGTKGGRTSGRRLGYSQIANPIYLSRKKTMAFDRAAAQISRNIMANIAKALWPEPWVDRRGRLVGNLMGLADLLRGQVDPRKITAI